MGSVAHLGSIFSVAPVLSKLHSILKPPHLFLGTPTSWAVLSGEGASARAWVHWLSALLMQISYRFLPGQVKHGSLMTTSRCSISTVPFSSASCTSCKDLSSLGWLPSFQVTR